ncbi:MAG: hypothetical protein ACM3XM_15510 [Mycobacterium leprae]
MLPWWWWPLFCATKACPAIPAIFQGAAKVNGQEGGSNIIVGPSSSSGFPGTGGGGGEGGAGGGGGNSTISLTDLRGDCGVAGVGYAFVISAGSIQLGGGQAGGGGNQAGRATSGGATTSGAVPSDPPGTFRFSGNRDSFVTRPIQSRSAITYTHVPNNRTGE